MIICRTIKASSTILRKSFQRFCEENDETKHWQTALKMWTKRFPKIGRQGQHKIQRCIVHMNQKQTIPKIWMYWITSTSILKSMLPSSKIRICPFLAEKKSRVLGVDLNLTMCIFTLAELADNAWHYSFSEIEDSFYGSSLQETNQVIYSMKITSRFSWVMSNCRCF